MPPVTNTDSKLVGQYIGGVRIDRLLAKGLLSDVYLGFHPNLNIHVAVKILSPKVMAQGMSTERFIREGRALAQLAHPNIIKIHNVGVEQNKYFIVMDFVHDAVNLRTLAKKQFLKPYQSLIVTRRMAEALDYIHNKGFIHRDIKPANICLRQNGQPILMDFSLIKDESSDIQLTAPGTIMGTVNFMPPEQAQPGGPFGRVTPASDVYSLGATFYWLLTGQAPFKGRTPMETIIKLIRDPVVKASEVNESVPAEIDELCIKCLQKNPADRFQSARELITAIDTAVQRKRAEIQAMRAPEASGESGGSGRAPQATGRLPSPPPSAPSPPQTPSPQAPASWGTPGAHPTTRSMPRSPGNTAGSGASPSPQNMSPQNMSPQNMAPPQHAMAQPPQTRSFAPPPPQSAFAPPPGPPPQHGSFAPNQAPNPHAHAAPGYAPQAPNPLSPPSPGSSAAPLQSPSPHNQQALNHQQAPAHQAPAHQAPAHQPPQAAPPQAPVSPPARAEAPDFAAPAHNPEPAAAAPRARRSPGKSRNPLLKARPEPAPKKSKLPLIIILLVLILLGGGAGAYYHFYGLPF